MPEPITDYVVTSHAAGEMERRGIDVELVRTVLREPEQRLAFRPGREVLQSKALVGGRMYLIRVFVDVDRSPAEVVTVYRTSKISKYWRNEP
jgi:hypothetical protein